MGKREKKDWCSFNRVARKTSLKLCQTCKSSTVEENWISAGNSRSWKSLVLFRVRLVRHVLWTYRVTNVSRSNVSRRVTDIDTIINVVVGSFSREYKIRRCKTCFRETERVSHATDFPTVTVSRGVIRERGWRNSGMWQSQTKKWQNANIRSELKYNCIIILIFRKYRI